MEQLSDELDAARRRMADLRTQAEKRGRLLTTAADDLSPAEVRRLVQELQIHQIELEMQYEELLIAQTERETLHQQYVDLFDFAPIGYCTLDEQGVVRQLNLRAGQLLGVPRGLVLGQPFIQYVPLGAERTHFHEFWQRVLTADERQTTELEMQRPDGSSFFALLEGMRLRDGRNEQWCRVALADDTARRQAVTRLAASERKFRALFTESADAAVLLRGFVLADCNRAALAMLGASRPDQLVGRSALLLTPEYQPDGMRSAQRLVQSIEAAQRDGSHRFEWLRHRFTGEEIWQEIVLTPIRVDGEGIVHAVWRDITEQKEQARRLRDSETRFRSLFEQSAEGMLLLQEGRYVDCNAAALRLIGAERREQLVGQPADVCTPPGQPGGQPTREWFAENVALARRDGSRRYEALMQRFTGGEIWVEGVLTAIELAGQSPLIHVSWREVTQRRLSEQHARESEKRLKTAIEAADMGIGIWNFSTQMFYVDARARRMFGLPPEGPELSFEELMAVVHPDDVALAADALHQAAAGAGPLDVQVRVQHPDGTVRYVAANGQVMHGDEGAAVRMSGVLRDVTETHEATARLSADAAFLQGLVSNIQEGILAFDAELRVTEWNYLMEQYMGVRRADILGQPIFAVLPAIDQPAYRTILERALAGETLTRYNLPFSFRPGVFDAAFVPLRDASGTVTGALGVIRDATERNRLMEDATQARLQREKEVLSAIMHTQEDERKRIAEALHNGVGQLLYAAKLHLYNQPVDETHRAAALGLLNEAIKATRTISFELTPNILEDFGLETALEELCKRIPKQSLAVHLSVGALPLPLPRLLETAVYRIVQELLNNVLKHARAREAFIYVEPLNHHALHVSVEDDGAGFDVEAATQQRNGIGLAGIRNRVGLLAGQLTIRSKPGRGTTVSMELPLGPEAGETATAAARPG
jgi:PAS domain S-box-containing protein